MASPPAWAAGGPPGGGREADLPPGPHRPGGGRGASPRRPTWPCWAPSPRRRPPRPVAPRSAAPPASAPPASTWPTGARRRRSSGGLPEGVIVAELGAALAEHEALVRERLYGLVGFDDRPGALNAARWDGGTFVYVPRGVDVELPVEALLTASGAAGRVFGRTLVVVEEGAKATVIDRYDSPDFDAPVNASSVVELYVGQGAELEHVSVIGWGAGVRHHALLRARVDRDARARSVVVTLGGDVVRVEPTLVCAGPGLRRPGAGPLLRRRRAALRAPGGRAPRGAAGLLEPALQGRDPGPRPHGLLRQPGGAPGRARHRRLPDQPQPRPQRRRARRHDPVPRDRDRRGQVLPRRGGRPRGRRAPLLPALARRPRGGRQAADRDGLPPGGPGAGVAWPSCGRSSRPRCGRSWADRGRAHPHRRRLRGRPRCPASRCSSRSRARPSCW